MNRYYFGSQSRSSRFPSNKIQQSGKKEKTSALESRDRPQISAFVPRSSTEYCEHDNLYNFSVKIYQPTCSLFRILRRFLNIVFSPSFSLVPGKILSIEPLRFICEAIGKLRYNCVAATIIFRNCVLCITVLRIIFAICKVLTRMLRSVNEKARIQSGRSRNCAWQFPTDRLTIVNVVRRDRKNDAAYVHEPYGSKDRTIRSTHSHTHVTRSLCPSILFFKFISIPIKAVKVKWLSQLK